MVEVANRTQGRLPRVAWEAIARRMLGRRFDLSVALVGERLMAEIKNKYPSQHSQGRGGSGATNVLSFLINKNAGEIFLCPAFIRREARLFGRSFHDHILALYVHALLHLKGFDHFRKTEALHMEKAEKKWLKILR